MSTPPPTEQLLLWGLVPERRHTEDSLLLAAGTGHGAGGELVPLQKEVGNTMWCQDPKICGIAFPDLKGCSTQST